MFRGCNTGAPVRYYIQAVVAGVVVAEAVFELVLLTDFTLLVT